VQGLLPGALMLGAFLVDFHDLYGAKSVFMNKEFQTS
jgi:hypothetical protein